MTISFERVKSGIISFDKIIDNIRIGDNVVWQVDNIEDYAYFVTKFIENAKEENRNIVYIRFANHKPLLEEDEK